jgi:hypothetical protein
MTNKARALQLLKCAMSVLVFTPSLALAHHSSAIFDVTKSVTLAGTVKAYQWSNPHCWIQVLVPSRGTVAEWSVEMGSPSQLYRRGWRPGTLKFGDKVTVVIHPIKDGSKGGAFVSGVGPTGEAFEPRGTQKP